MFHFTLHVYVFHSDPRLMVQLSLYPVQYIQYWIQYGLEENIPPEWCCQTQNPVWFSSEAKQEAPHELCRLPTGVHSPVWKKDSLHTSVMQQTFSLNVPNYIIHNTLCMLMLHNAHLDSINVCFSIFLTLIHFVFVFLNLLQQFLFKKKKKFKVKSWA